MATNEPERHPLAQAVIDAHDNLAPKLAEAKRQNVTDLLHQLEDDLAPLIGPVVQKVIDNPATSDELRALLNEAGIPAHQFGSLVIGFAIYGVLGPALGAGLQPEIQGILNVAWSNNASRPLSPDVLAEMALKGVPLGGNTAIGGADLEREAAESGINPARFRAMSQAAGQSIGLAEALLLERRKQWVGATIDEALAYSNMNPKFYASAKNLVYAPPSVGEVITGALKGHLNDRDPAAMIGEAGVNPDNFAWLLASAGRPPGTMEMLDLWNRHDAGLPGYITTQVDVEQAVRQSDINDVYTPHILTLRHYLPPVRSVVPMLSKHAITPADAGQLLDAHGVVEPWKSAILAEGQHPTTSHIKSLTQGQIVANYELRLMDRPTATARLEALTYSAADATALLDLADERRAQTLMNATITMVGRKYVTYKLAHKDAVSLLATAGVANAAQLDLFRLWDIERQANVHVPTPASIVGAYRRTLISAAECKTRLLELGIDAADLRIVVGDGFPPTKPLEAIAAADAVEAA